MQNAYKIVIIFFKPEILVIVILWIREVNPHHFNKIFTNAISNPDSRKSLMSFRSDFMRYLKNERSLKCLELE